MAKAADTIEYECWICCKKLISSAIFESHMNDEHPGIFYECNICGDLYTSKIDLTIHINEEHTENATALTCDTDDGSSASENLLEEHSENNLERESIIQSESESSVEDINQAINYNCKKHICRKCPRKSFSRKDDLQRHINTKHRGELQKCAECDGYYWCGLQSHMCNKHD